MADAPPFVSFLSDYGLADEFVGVCKSVIWQLAPEARIVDVTHEIAPHDVRAGALALSRALRWLPGGVVLAVVDPGVGTDRRVLAVEVEAGHLVGPDNGLLAPAVAMLGGARRAVALTNPAYQLVGPGPTFAGRDVMAPAAGHLAAGVDVAELGDDVDPAALMPGLLPVSHEEAGAVAGEVWWIDRYGNCQLNVDPDTLEELGARPGDTIEVRVREDVRTARWVHTYADARPSELVLLVDSYGLTSLALDRSSAAADLRLRSGSPVTLVPPPRRRPSADAP